MITRPALKETLGCLAYLLGGFLLSCGQVGGQPAPFALGLLASAGGGLRGLCALIGAVLGFLLMQPFSLGLELTSIALLTFVTMYIFGSLWVTKQRWFHCLVPGAMSAAVGGIFLLGQDLSPLLLAGFGQTIFLSALSPLAFDALLEKKRSSVGALLALCFFLMGAAMIPMPVGLNLGLILAVTAASAWARSADRRTAVLLGACAGLALDGALMTGGRYTLCLTGAALACSGVPKAPFPIRMALFLAGFSATVLYTASAAIGLFLSLGIGMALSLALPGGLITGQEESAIAQVSAQVEQQLGYGATALKQLYDAIGMDPQQKAFQSQQRIFDRTAAKVCRSCSHYSRCWEKNSTETYQTLREAMEPILHRGAALPEDFSEEFSLGCRHMDLFLSALNQELDDAASQYQLHNRAEESRLIASRCYFHLSALMEQNAKILRTAQRFPKEAYAVKLGVSAAGRHGARVSGDRGVSFHTEDGRFFVLLCDGMGTGQTAAQESLLAVDTLAALVQSGLAPDGAMELLDGMYILRDSGGFSTIDILELSLITGQGTLYKWGAAPSYLKCGAIVKKIGAAAPPPGLGVGSTNGAETIRLSLWGGDMLVLASDGLASDEAERIIRSFEGENVKELSARLVAGAAELGGEDDMTAAVVRLDALRS